MESEVAVVVKEYPFERGSLGSQHQRARRVARSSRRNSCYRCFVLWCRGESTSCAGKHDLFGVSLFTGELVETAIVASPSCEYLDFLPRHCYVITCADSHLTFKYQVINCSFDNSSQSSMPSSSFVEVGILRYHAARGPLIFKYSQDHTHRSGKHSASKLIHRSKVRHPHLSSEQGHF